MDIILIAAVTADGLIARHSHEMIDWSQDLHVFKKQTMNYPVIMGSNTFKCMKNELSGRMIIVIHRGDKPKTVLENIKSDKCFIAGGGRTNALFSQYLTHLYLTPHPYVFGKGVPLFYKMKEELQLKLIHKYTVNEEIEQLQYRVVR
jgi:dihydrofolate reductase